jgi:hypothetical protein
MAVVYGGLTAILAGLYAASIRLFNSLFTASEGQVTHTPCCRSGPRPYSPFPRGSAFAAKALQVSGRRVGMPKLVITHAVVDVERWLKGKEERVTAFSPFATHVTDHVALDGSNTIAITADVHDLAGAQAMLASPPPETAAAMERHGVIQPVTAFIEK